MRLSPGKVKNVSSSFITFRGALPGDVSNGTSPGRDDQDVVGEALFSTLS
jgi:hypothetical protein